MWFTLIEELEESADVYWETFIFFFSGTTDYSVCESPHSSPYNSESDLISEVEEEVAEESSSYEGIKAVLISCLTTLVNWIWLICVKGLLVVTMWLIYFNV